MDSLLPLSSIHPSIFSPLFQTLLHLFIFFFSLQVNSSWLFFPSSKPCGFLPFFLDPIFQFLSCQKVMAGLTSLFNGCYTSYGQPATVSLLSLSLSSAFSQPFSFILSLIYIFPSPYRLAASALKILWFLHLSLWFMLPCGFELSHHFPEATPTQKERTGRTDQMRKAKRMDR